MTEQVELPEVAEHRRYRIAVGVAVLLFLALLIRSFDPFGWFVPKPTETPAVAGEPALITLRDAAELKVATGTYSVPVVIDVQKSGLRGKLPDFLDNEQIVAIYEADVDVLIDLRRLTEDAIEADPETRTIKVTVPAPMLSKPAINPDKSRIISHDRGVIQRLEDALGPGSLEAKERLDQAAVEAIDKAARESNLPEVGRTNGTEFLRLLCEKMGYTNITIEYADPPN